MLPVWENCSQGGLKTGGNACRNERASHRPLTLCLMFVGQAELLSNSGAGTESQAKIC